MSIKSNTPPFLFNAAYANANITPLMHIFLSYLARTFEASLICIFIQAPRLHILLKKLDVDEASAREADSPADL